MKDRYGKQTRYTRRKSAVYQNARFYKYGTGYTVINSLMALTDAIQSFNESYGDNLEPRHGVLCVLIHNYMVATQAEVFNEQDIFNYYKNLTQIFGYYAAGHRSFLVVFNDLMKFHFINPLGHSYNATTRLKLFCKVLDQHAKAYFIDPTDEK
jgi:hypothetical protein